MWLGDLPVALDEGATVYKDQDWLRALRGDRLGIWIVYVELYDCRSLFHSAIPRMVRQDKPCAFQCCRIGTSDEDGLRSPHDVAPGVS